MFLCPLKTTENQRSSDISRGYSNRTLGQNRLKAKAAGFQNINFGVKFLHLRQMRSGFILKPVKYRCSNSLALNKAINLPSKLQYN